VSKLGSTGCSLSDHCMNHRSFILNYIFTESASVSVALRVPHSLLLKASPRDILLVSHHVSEYPVLGPVYLLTNLKSIISIFHLAFVYCLLLVSCSTFHASPLPVATHLLFCSSFWECKNLL
jgi:hypothetical protein